MSRLRFLIGGYEHGGTTLLSELFRANGFEAGFECGVLLADTPREMVGKQPYYDKLLSNWGIDKDTRALALSGDFNAFYDTICSVAFPEFDGYFFDKTPKYMESIGSCLHKAEFVKGAVIIHRDPRAVFLSMTKRISPELDVVSGIERNFARLSKRYLSYFYGSIGHIYNDKVLFVPFEELVSRECMWLTTIGHFVGEKPFRPRTSSSRFSNVSSDKMDIRKVSEFDRVLPAHLQNRILEATKVASLFFACPSERALYHETWDNIITTATIILNKFELPFIDSSVGGEYFEPITYLIRYPDVLKAGLNPVEHYRKYGRREGRRAC